MKKFILCKILGWHFPDKSRISNDGASNISKCINCGKDIMEDSQGNWFAYKERVSFWSMIISIIFIMLLLLAITILIKNF